MQIGTTLSLIGASSAACLFAWQRQWIMSLAWLFSLAYTIFSRIFPTALPEVVVVSFSFLFLAMVLLYVVQKFSNKRKKI